MRQLRVIEKPTIGREGKEEEKKKVSKTCPFHSPGRRGKSEGMERAKNLISLCVSVCV